MRLWIPEGQLHLQNAQLTPTNNVVHFDFKQNQLRVLVDEKGEPWFLGKDILNALDIFDSYTAYKRLADEEKTYTARNCVGLGKGRDVVLVSEPGLYKLVMRSDKKEAIEFQNWIAQEVLPSIRKTGSYTAPGAKPPSAPDLINMDRKGLLAQLQAVTQIAMEAEEERLLAEPTQTP